MALTPQQRAILTKAMVPKRKKKDTSGGRGYQEWKDDPGAMWRPPSTNGAVQARPIPNSTGTVKPNPIPNASGRRRKGPTTNV